MDERVGQNVQPLFGGDAGKVANGRLSASGFRLSAFGFVAAKLDAGINDLKSITRETQIAAHEVRVVLAGGDVAIDVRAIGADLGDRLSPDVGREHFKIDVIALQ